MLLYLSILFYGNLISSVSANDNTTDIESEIEKIKIEDAAYYLSELKQQNRDQRTLTLSKFGYDINKVDNVTVLKELAQEMVNESIIYYMDVDGNVYDKNANFLNPLQVHN